MANKQISQLPAAQTMNDGDLLVCEQNGVAKRLAGSVLMAMINSHGGITNTSYTPPVAPSLQGTLTLTFTDGTSTSIPIYNGAKGDTGAQGEQGERGAAFTYEDFTPEQLESLRGEQGIQGVPGNPGYVHIKWASIEPTSDADIGDIPDAWMGIYSGSSSTAPTAYTAYAWYEIKGATGAAGADGSRGSYIWRLKNLPAVGNNNWTIPASDLIAPPFDAEATPRGGDLAFYGDVYYCFTGAIITGGYELVGETYINSAALPESGTTGQVLAKLSDNSYDVGWVDQTGGDSDIFWAERNVTTLAELKEHISDGDVVMLNYGGLIYSVYGYSENYVYFIAVTPSKIYTIQVSASAWSSSNTYLNDYSYLSNLPRINGYTLSGNKTGANLGLIDAPSSAVSGNYLRYNGTAWVAGTGGGGTTNYNDLTNRPSINHYLLTGNMSAAALGLASAADVAAKITAPSSPATGAFLVWNGSAWTAQTLSTWNGGSY